MSQKGPAGAPFPASAEYPGQKIGLVGLRERAYLVGGTLRIDTTLGEGTAVEVDIPVASVHVALAHDGRGTSRTDR